LSPALCWRLQLHSCNRLSKGSAAKRLCPRLRFARYGAHHSAHTPGNDKESNRINDANVQDTAVERVDLSQVAVAEMPLSLAHGVALYETRHLCPPIRVMDAGFVPDE